MDVSPKQNCLLSQLWVKLLLTHNIFILSKSNSVDVVVTAWELQSPLGRASLWHSPRDTAKIWAAGFIKPVAMGEPVLKNTIPYFLLKVFQREPCVCGFIPFVCCSAALLVLRLVWVWIGSITGYWDSSCFTNWLGQGQRVTLSADRQQQQLEVMVWLRKGVLPVFSLPLMSKQIS